MVRKRQTPNPGYPPPVPPTPMLPKGWTRVSEVCVVYGAGAPEGLMLRLELSKEEILVQ